jgi:maleate isomerase
VKIPVALDQEPDRKRIGVVVFDEDTTTEDALARLKPADASVAVHISRMPLPMGSGAAVLDKTAADLAQAAARLAPSTQLDAVAYSCTTGALELGYERVVEAVRRGRPGASVATPMTGALKAFAALGVRKISVLTPYGQAHNDLIGRALEAGGMDVVRFCALSVAAELDYARVSFASLRAASAMAVGPQAEALFVSCTALRATELIAELEADLDCPVVTSTQAMWWEALQLARAPARREGAGRLFAL